VSPEQANVPMLSIALEKEKPQIFGYFLRFKNERSAPEVNRAKLEGSGTLVWVKPSADVPAPDVAPKLDRQTS
jgi:hypothetical protein